MQVGNVNDFRTEDSVGQSTGLTASQVQANWAQAEQTLTDYMTSFQQRNPHLHVYNAVMHNDEARPTCILT
ncbi:plasmid recombination protein [Schleiferilactobacillus harbinensis]|uniref:plasmid recombination protein n=1 Tax=Schleiferilactobacillus harbinensis TaxID=304207 RepID=UPI0039BF49BB